MARAELNPVLDELHGALGDVVFKRYGSKIFVSRKPDLSDHKPTPAQKAQRERFRQAMAYASRAVADPAVKALYAEAAAARQKPLLSVAVKDHMNAPTVDGVDATAYSGQAGDEIVVWAGDDFGVAEVRVAVTEKGGGVIEEGNAAESPPGSGRWVYTARATAPAGAAAYVKVQALDRPGNVAEASHTIGDHD
jgi:hypothetical protein